MRVWRLTRRPFADLSGDGARRYGGRWTSPGRPVVYTAGAPATALLEVLVHLDVTPELMPADYVLMEIELPADISMRTAPATLPTTAAAFRAAGDSWLAAGLEAVLAVPSVIVPRERNYLINPLHPDASRLRILGIEDFVVDPRLL